MPDIYDGTTSLIGLSSFGGEHQWCPSPVSAVTPDIDLQDVKFPVFVEDQNSFEERSTYHLHPDPPQLISNIDRCRALSICDEEVTSTTTTGSVYLDLDCPETLERKVFDPENMETRGCKGYNSSRNTIGNSSNWPRPSCQLSGNQTRWKNLPYFTRSSGDLSGWKHLPPERWTPEQVMDWVYSVASRYSIDHAIRGEAMRGTNGSTLCCMKLQDFAMLGDESHALILYDELCKVQQKYRSQTNENRIDYGFASHDDPQFWFGHDTSLQNTTDYSSHQWQNPTINSNDGHHHPQRLPKIEIKTEVGVPLKRKRGRPRKYPKPDPMVPKQPKQRGRKPGQRSKGHHLWEFLRDLLSDSSRSQLIRWEDRQNGVFRIVDSKGVSDLWGERKKNHSMTYEKLSRAIRFCQKESVGYFSRLPDTATYPKKLCFKFGPKTWGWQLS